MAYRKPRSDSKLKHLPEKNPEQAKQLVDWLLGGMSYEKAVLLLEKAPFHIKTSTRAIGEFYADFCLEPLLAQRQRSATIAKGIRKEASKNPADFDQATLDLLEMAAFELSRAKTLNVKDTSKLLMLLLKRRAQDSKDKDRELAREKFKADFMTKIEAGMEAIHAEIKDNPKALAAYKAMKDAMTK